MMSLASKTALITGGGTGIGAAVALKLASEECRVANINESGKRIDCPVESPVVMLRHRVPVAPVLFRLLHDRWGFWIRLTFQDV